MSNERPQQVFVNSAPNMQYQPNSQGFRQQPYLSQRDELRQNFPTVVVIAHSVILTLVGIVFVILQILLLTNTAYLAGISGGLWCGK